MRFSGWFLEEINIQQSWCDCEVPHVKSCFFPLSLFYHKRCTCRYFQRAFFQTSWHPPLLNSHGISTGTRHILWEKQWFPVCFPVNESISRPKLVILYHFTYPWYPTKWLLNPHGCWFNSTNLNPPRYYVYFSSKTNPLNLLYQVIPWYPHHILIFVGQNLFGGFLSHRGTPSYHPF